MLKRSTVLLSAGLVVGSAVLAGLWQTKGPRLFTPTRKPAAVAVDRVAEPAPDKGQGTVRSVYPGLVAGTAPPQRDVGERPSPSPNALRPEAPPSPPSDTRAGPGPAPPLQGPPPAPDAAPADLSAGPPPLVPEGGSVDLNTGSVEDLNRLGAGMIGRRIVGGRPYASPEDLVNRRVLTRKDFDRIKAQIVVQTSPVANP